MKSDLQTEKDARRSVKKLAAKAVRKEKQKQIKAEKDEAIIRLDKWVRGMRMHGDMTLDIDILKHTVAMWENEVYPEMLLLEKYFTDEEQELFLDAILANGRLNGNIKRLQEKK